MLGIKLVIHAIKMLFRNPWVTLRLTVFPLVIGWALALFVVSLFSSVGLNEVLTRGVVPKLEPGLGGLLVGWLAMFIVFATMFWAAKSWHRFVLLGDPPGRLLPRNSRAFALSYIWAVIRLALVWTVLRISIVFLIASLMPPLDLNSPSGSISLTIELPPLFYFLTLLLYALTLRIGLVLPGAAVGKPISLMQSWQFTKGITLSILVVTLILFGLDFLIESSFVKAHLNLPLFFVLFWFSYTLVISILTTLYGVCVEKREL